MTATMTAQEAAARIREALEMLAQRIERAAGHRTLAISAEAADAIRALLAERDEMAKDAARLQARLDALDNLPAEDFIRKVARQMGPPPFDTWPVSHVCQQNADEALELVEEYDRLAALTIKEQK